MSTIEINLIESLKSPLKYNHIDPNDIVYENHMQMSHIIMLIFELLTKNCPKTTFKNLKSVLLKCIMLLPHKELCHLSPGLISKMTKLLMTFKDKTIVYPSLEVVLIKSIGCVDNDKLCDYLQYLPFKIDMTNLLDKIIKYQNVNLLKSVANAFKYNLYQFRLSESQQEILYFSLIPEVDTNIVVAINLHRFKMINDYELILSQIQDHSYVKEVMDLIPSEYIYNYIEKDSSVLSFLSPFLENDQIYKHCDDLYWKSQTIGTADFLNDDILWKCLQSNNIVAIENIARHYDLSENDLIAENFDYIVDQASLALPEKDSITVLCNALSLMKNVDVSKIAMLMDDSIDFSIEILRALPKSAIILDVGALLYRYTNLMAMNTNITKIGHFEKQFPYLSIWLQQHQIESNIEKSDVVVRQEYETDDIHLLKIFKTAMHFISFENLKIRAIYLSIIYNCLELIRDHKLFLNSIYLIWEQLINRIEDENEQVVYFVFKILKKVAINATDFMAHKFDSLWLKMKRVILFYINEREEKMVSVAKQCLIAFIENCNLKKADLRELRRLGIKEISDSVDVLLPEEAYLLKQLNKPECI
eukprot:NODE_153_length_15389_cov_1.201439.p2 type:complete len:588 gc:universal NODE_153_length_15389_cov_1.201439:2798-4561(+)